VVDFMVDFQAILGAIFTFLGKTRVFGGQKDLR
jgi:hypothetical protein